MDISAFLFPLAIIAIFYFFIIRPQTKKQKDRQRMLDALEKGADVITIGGIHGKVVAMKNDDKILIIKVDDNVKLEIDRTAVSHIKGMEAPAKR